MLLLAYSLFAIIFFGKIENVWAVLLLNFTSIFFVLATPKINFRYNTSFTKVLHSFYFVPLFYLGYSQIHIYIPLLNHSNYDSTLAKLDFMLFGVNPTQWIYQFENKYLTEYLQIFYSAFQLILLYVAVNFYIKKDYKNFHLYTMALMFGFYLSYFSYIFFPAIGPRFEVHNFLNTDKELPGILVTQYLRDVINSANGVTAGTTDYFQTVKKDCMPSGHTMMSLVATYMCFKLNSRLKWFLVLSTASIMFSTIYLRYHYVVDMIAGIILSILVFFLLPTLEKLFRKLGIPI